MNTQSPAWLAAARVVRRSGFGATGNEVDALVRTGLPAYLASLAKPPADPGASATPMPSFSPITPAGKNASHADKLKIDQQRRTSCNR